MTFPANGEHGAWLEVSQRRVKTNGPQVSECQKFPTNKPSATFWLDGLNKSG